MIESLEIADIIFLTMDSKFSIDHSTLVNETSRSFLFKISLFFYNLEAFVKKDMLNEFTGIYV